MKVLIERKVKFSWRNEAGKELSRDEIVQKIIPDTMLESIEAMDENVPNPAYRWKVVKRFEEGEKIEKGIIEVKPEENELEKENKALKAELAKLKKPEVDPDLQAARELYFEAFGKKPNALLKTDGILKKIEDKK